MRKSATVTRKGHVAIVKFDRGERLNAFDRALVYEMIDVGRSFQDDFETRAIIVTGADNAFSSGADLKAINFTENMSPVEARHARQAGVRLCRIWEDLPQVTIAAINGLAVGAGVAFSIALDWRVMDSDAYFYVPEVRHGWHLQWGAIPRLVSLVGPARAKEAALLCEKMGASQALDWGLIDRMSAPGQAVAEAMKLAETIAEFDPVPVRMIKDAINAAAGANFRAVSHADADQNALSVLYAAQAAKRQE
ncbi:enoyl-CoA hydratase/isomerase family protein [Sneathiella sp.]|uniref:enoyl-CoA hydratase/isomerase family protein n=1 Tax=Sneathiella sp. TaxID=1964365 RepID=UPI002FE02ECF